MAADPSTSSSAPRVLRVLLDTNVVLDWLLDRKPWSDEALTLWQARDSGRLVTYIAASSLTDIFYIARRQIGNTAALASVDQSLVLEIASVDKAILLRARTLPGSDFEDNVVIACAEAERLDFIITRNLDDFRHSPIPAIEPLTLPNYLSA
jgi:predicted nucleic acid-binding protein